MSDLIRREDAIDYFVTNVCIVDADGYYVDDYDERVRIWTERFSGIPSAEPERKWIPVTEALPENRNVVLATVYWHETYQVMEASYFGSDWWCVPFNNCGKHMQKLNPIAWMPLPEPWRVE